MLHVHEISLPKFSHTVYATGEYDSSKLCLTWMGLLIFTHVSVDSSQTALQHHKPFNLYLC